MNYVLIHSDVIIGEESFADESARKHFAARRVKVGEQILAQDKNGERFSVEIVSIGKNEVKFIAREKVMLPEKPKSEITLIQAILSEQSLDFVLQKTTELGVEKIILFQSENSAAVIKKERLSHKIARWEKIMISACEQSGRAQPPVLEIKYNLEEALKNFSGTLFLADINGKKPEPELRCAIIIGPEGGLSEKEKMVAISKGAKKIKLGAYTLRAETAAIASISSLLQI